MHTRLNGESDTSQSDMNVTLDELINYLIYILVPKTIIYFSSKKTIVRRRDYVRLNIFALHNWISGTHAFVEYH